MPLVDWEQHSVHTLDHGTVRAKIREVEEGFELTFFKISTSHMITGFNLSDNYSLEEAKIYAEGVCLGLEYDQEGI